MALKKISDNMEVQFTVGSTVPHGQEEGSMAGEVGTCTPHSQFQSNEYKGETKTS